jgi:hypothetical protein
MSDLRQTTLKNHRGISLTTCSVKYTRMQLFFVIIIISFSVNISIYFNMANNRENFIAPDLYSRGIRFESWQGHRLY